LVRFPAINKIIYAVMIDDSAMSQNVWDEKIRDLPRILLPSFAVLDFALLNVSARSVSDHAGKKQWIKPREWAAEAGD